MTTTSRLLACSLFAPALPVVALAQQSPYTGQQTRQVKARSQAEIDDLLAGRGMGLARAAELNGFPGPLHVLELSGELQLSKEQEESTRQVFTRMQAAARELGAQLVAAEAELDALFGRREVDKESLAEALARIGDLQARLRGVHLAVHLDQAEILSPKQLARYMQLRGYTEGDSHQPAHDHRGH